LRHSAFGNSIAAYCPEALKNSSKRTLPEKELLMDLHGKVAIITGAASGIGYGIAKRFAAAGGRVVIADVRLDAAEKAAREISGPDKALAVAMDVTSEEAVNLGVEKTVGTFGTVDILVSNAGVQIVYPIEAFPFADWFSRMTRLSLFTVKIGCGKPKQPPAGACRAILWCFALGLRQQQIFSLEAVLSSMMDTLPSTGFCGRAQQTFTRPAMSQLFMTPSLPGAVISNIGTMQASKAALPLTTARSRPESNAPQRCSIFAKHACEASRAA
jgi:NAD(P)-dependent dehydrogenase (short-subunit alcohol dehydrogenase family)